MSDLFCFQLKTGTERPDVFFVKARNKEEAVRKARERKRTRNELYFIGSFTDISGSFSDFFDSLQIKRWSSKMDEIK